MEGAVSRSGWDGERLRVGQEGWRSGFVSDIWSLLHVHHLSSFLYAAYVTPFGWSIWKGTLVPCVLLFTGLVFLGSHFPCTGITYPSKEGPQNC